MSYIQQAYQGKLGYWKYLAYTLAFLGFMALNVYASANSSSSSMEETIKQAIEQYGSNLVLLQMLSPFVVFLLLLFFWVKFIHKQSLISLTTSRQKIDWNRIFFSFALWGILTVLMIGVSYFLNPEALKLNFRPRYFLGLLLISVVLIPIQTSFEEYFFRGYLMQGIGAKFKSKILPLLITSVVFGLMHYGNPEVEKLGDVIMIYYIGTGLFLGILTLMDEGLELALGFHCANNLITALLVTSEWTAFQTESVFKDFSQPELTSTVFIPVFVLYPILLFLFSKKYNWTNWKEHLLGKIEQN